MSVMRQRIAEHMVLSKRVSPHVYSIDEADMTRIAHVREQARAEFERRHQMKLTFMPFFVRACVDALRDFPMVNASVDGTNVVVHGGINIGIAVALDWGLIVPVLKNAEEKNFLGLQRGISDLAERARAEKAEARGSSGEHFLHHESGHLRRVDGSASDQSAQRSHFRYRGHPEAPSRH